MTLRPFRTVLSLAVALSLVAVPAASAQAPGSMSGLGDSITRAYNACGLYFECTSRSWATGSDIDSVYTRILKVNPAIRGKNFNDASSGARMRDLNAQALKAVSRKVDLVTIEMGGNDVCTRTEAEMTSVTSFRTQFQQALKTLTAGLPNARIRVASIPDVKKLWAAGKGNILARSVWNIAKICQSLLASPTSTAAADTARRDRVRQRAIDFNAQLAQVCAQYAQCQTDGGAAFAANFGLSEISKFDYFHPNADGQRKLASVAWAAWGL